MKAQIIAVFAMLCVVGCAHQDKHDYFPPSSVEVQRSVQNTKDSAIALKPHITKEGEAAYQSLLANIKSTQEKFLDFEAKVGEQSKELSKAKDEANYWHDKQSKALKELWWWRGAALVILATIIVGAGIKTGWRFFL
jgi:hypothetical protein